MGFKNEARKSRQAVAGIGVSQFTREIDQAFGKYWIPSAGRLELVVESTATHCD